MLSRFNGLAVVALLAFAGCDLFGGGGSGIGGRGDRDRDDDDRDEDEDCDPECDADEVCKDGECVARADTGGEGEGEGPEQPDPEDPDDEDPVDGDECSFVDDDVCLDNDELCLDGGCVIPEDVSCPGLGETFLDPGGLIIIDAFFELDAAFNVNCPEDHNGVFVFAEIIAGDLDTVSAAAIGFGEHQGTFNDDDTDGDESLAISVCAPAAAVAGDLAYMRVLDGSDVSSNLFCGTLE